MNASVLGPLVLAVCVLALCLSACTRLTAAEEQGMTFYVATDGNDAWSGKLAAPNAEKSDGPFATLGRARDAACALRNQQGGTLKQPVTVLLRGGTYFLAEPVEFGSRDAGSAACPITYAAFEGETPILSGGREIAGPWKQEEQGIYQVTLPEVREGKWAFRQLFVAKKSTNPPPSQGGGGGGLDPRPAPKPNPHPSSPWKGEGSEAFSRRYRPSKGPFIIAGLTDSPTAKTTMRHRQSQQDFIFAAGDIDPKWSNLGDAEVVALHDWSASRLRIASIDAEKHVVKFTGWPVYRIGHWYKGGRNPYFVENVKEAGLKPGEWYLDRPTGVLAYRPLPGEEMDKLTVVAPRTEQLIRLVGKSEQAVPFDESYPFMVVKDAAYVEHVRFRGITFAHTAWALPEEGYSSGQGMVDLPAAVHAEFARKCRFERCTLAHLGCYAVRLDQGCHDNEVAGCRLFDLGGGGVLIGVTNAATREPYLPTGNAVANCVISDGGLVHFSAHGIWIGISARSAARHNVVRRFPYSTVSVGWSWNDKPTPCRENVVEANHIHDAMMLLADGGGIYSLGLQPGTTLRGNHIHDVHRSPFAGSAPNNGIFLDEGSKGFLIESNVIYACANGPIRHNRNKHDDHTWKDNVLDVRPDDPKFPDAAKAVVATAGLEPAWRDIDQAVEVTPSPIYSMKLPPPPPPGPITDDFESTPVGQLPRNAANVCEEKGGTIRVTDETAASGKRSLKFTDAPGLSKDFYPYMQYSPSFVEGVPTISFALRVDAGARVSVEGREEAHTATGWQVGIGPDGALSAGGRGLVTIPLGQWVRLEIVCGLGAKSTGTWDLVVTLPGQNPQRFDKLPLAKKDYRRFGYLVLTSGATDKAVFYLDDLKLVP